MAVYEYDNIEVETPDPVSDEVLNVYVSDASNTNKGIAKFNYEQFDVINGEVKIKKIFSYATNIKNGTGSDSLVGNDLTKNVASGSYSIALGRRTKAAEDNSYAEGLETVASGYTSHAEGTHSTASNNYAHAEGSFTAASGISSHAEGSVTKAIGTYSHAEGRNAIAQGDASHAEGLDTKAISEGTHAGGNSSIAGLKGYYWSEIDYDNNKITLATAHLNGTTLTKCDYAVGDIISIVNDSKYDYCSTITGVGGGVITVDTLPFTTTVEGDNSWDAYTAFCVDKPEKGLVDLGINAFATGENCKATNSHSFVAGRDNQVIGEYGVSFGRDNVSGYASFTAGRNNKYYGQAGAMFGQDNSGTGNKQFSFGFNNQHGNYKQTYSIGYNNTMNAEKLMGFGNSNSLGAREDVAIGHSNNLNLGESLTTGENVAIGVQNSIRKRRAVALGYSNTVTTARSTVGASDFAGAFGSNNNVSNNHAGAIGRSNVVTNYGTWALGIGLNSTCSYQTLLGAYNESSGLYEDTAKVIVGGGSSLENLKTLATISATGDLHLAGNQITLRDSDGSDISIDSVGVKELDKFRENVGIFTALTMFKTDTAFAGKVTMAKDLTVAGNFKVTGTTTVQDVKNLAVEDLTITLSKNAPLGVSLAGIIVPDYNGMSQPGGLVFDDTGTAYVGDVSVSSDGVVTQGDARPIAVRSDAVEWSENSIPRWSSTFDGFEPSGFTTGTFAQKLDKIETVAGEHKIYTSINGVQGSVDIATTPDVDGIPIYGTGGVLLVNAGTGNRHCVNLKQMNDALAKKLDLVTPTYPSLYGATKEGQRQYLINNTPNTGYIPQYAVGGILRTNTGVDDTDCVNLKQMKDYVPVKAGTPTNSLTNNDSNTLISEGAVAFGSNNVAGQKGYYWSEIDTTNKTITLATKHTGGEPVTCEYEVGDVLSIVIASTVWLDIITVSAVSNNIVTYSGNPYFPPSLSSSDGIYDSFVYCVNKPTVGYTTAPGDFSYASGRNNCATLFGTALGSGSKAVGFGGSAFGLKCQATQYAFATGNRCVAAGRCSVAVGAQNSANNTYAFCGGMGSTASGYSSFVWGYDASANAVGAVVFGTGTKSAAGYQLVIGKYNARTSDASFMIGNGTSHTARSNSLEATVDGNLRLAGSSIKLNAFGSDPVEITADTMSKLNPVRHWIATLTGILNDSLNRGQVEFWSTGTPNSTTNPTNLSDLFAKRVGYAEVFVETEALYYRVADLMDNAIHYYTTYPFGGAMDQFNFTSYTLSEITN